jgi:CBS domain-containing protein
MNVQRIFQTSVDTATPDESAFQAAERMHQRTVGALVVVSPDESPIGIVTDRDLAIRVVAAGRDPYTTPIREVMTADLKTAAADASIDAALTMMNRGGFRRLPIVDKKGRLAGMVALDDIVMLMSEELGRVGGILKRATPQAAAEASADL